MLRRFLAVLAASIVLPAAAQSVPAANYTDMWWNASESGWGISFTQHAGSNQVFAVWFTYDPRETDPASGQRKPLWIVMPGGTWTTPTTITGSVYVLNGVPFNQTGSNRSINPVGTFTFTFSSVSAGTFAYNIAAPAGIPSTDPAAGLPTFAGTKNIVRQSF